MDSDDRFRDALATLEGRGAVVLVLGAGVAAAHAAVSRQLMGSTEFDRRRVVALAGPDRPDVGSHLPPGAPRDEDHLRVVTEGVPTRDGAAAAAQPSVTAGPGSSAPSDDGGLDVGAFGASISTAVDDLEPSGGFDPGELRVAVDGLEPLFGAVPDEDVVQFVHLLGHRIRRATGKAHFHLATDPEDSRAKLVGNVADLVIELSVVDGTPHQQWHVRNGPTSRRVPVPLDDERDE